MSAAPNFCNACGGQLQWRLGAWECAQCGAVAGQPQSVAAQVVTAGQQYAEFESGQYFSRDNNKTSKYWCVGIYAFLNLLPSMAGAALLVFIFNMFGTMGGEPMDKEMTTITSIMLVVVLVSLVFNSISAIVFYLMLFSDVLWLKWLCLAQVLWSVLGSILFILAPQSMMKPEDYKSLQELGAVAGGWLVLGVGFLQFAFAIWLTLIIWPDIRGLRESRRLKRQYA
jgi:hypothetical protein